MTSFEGPLAGVRVLGLTSVVSGPFATQILAQLCADVIKVESPQGDDLRRVGPMRNAGMGSIFLHANGGKMSVALDLKTAEGREDLLAMVAEADVFVSQLR